MSIKIDSLEVVGLEHAIRGMRNSLQIGPRDNDTDLDILERFSSTPDKTNAITRDPLKMIHLYADITAPLYFWMDVNAVTPINSIYEPVRQEIYFRKANFTIDDFSVDLQTSKDDIEEIKRVIDILNTNLHEWREGHRTEHGGWYTTHADHIQILRILPLCYNHKQTVDISYRDLKNIYHVYYWRCELSAEWHEFLQFIEELPYSELIINEDKQCEQERQKRQREEMLKKRG